MLGVKIFWLYLCSCYFLPTYFSFKCIFVWLVSFSGCEVELRRPFFIILSKPERSVAALLSLKQWFNINMSSVNISVKTLNLIITKGQLSSLTWLISRYNHRYDWKIHLLHLILPIFVEAHTPLTSYSHGKNTLIVSSIPPLYPNETMYKHYVQEWENLRPVYPRSYAPNLPVYFLTWHSVPRW